MISYFVMYSLSSKVEEDLDEVEILDLDLRADEIVDPS
jgi:hypothetical protein